MFFQAQIFLYMFLKIMIPFLENESPCAALPSATYNTYGKEGALRVHQRFGETYTKLTSFSLVVVYHQYYYVCGCILIFSVSKKVI